MRRILLTICVLAIGIASVGKTDASLVVDFSPDTTGSVTIFRNHFQLMGFQYLGDQFTWGGGFLTGGSIFSESFNGSIGDSVEFVVLPGHAPGAGAGVDPVIQFTTTIDAIDGLFTTIDTSMNRKHASIAPTFLAAGNYWFYMAGNVVDIRQGVGDHDDFAIEAGFDGLPDLEAGTYHQGDTFFQLEGTVVPEPSSLALLGIAGFGLVLNRRRKR